MTGATSEKPLNEKSANVLPKTQGTTCRRRSDATGKLSLKMKSENDLVDIFPPTAGIAKRSSNAPEGVGPL